MLVALKETHTLMEMMPKSIKGVKTPYYFSFCQFMSDSVSGFTYRHNINWRNQINLLEIQGKYYEMFLPGPVPR